MDEVKPDPSFLQALRHNIEPALKCPRCGQYYVVKIQNIHGHCKCNFCGAEGPLSHFRVNDETPI